MVKRSSLRELKWPNQILPKMGFTQKPQTAKKGRLERDADQMHEFQDQASKKSDKSWNKVTKPTLKKGLSSWYVDIYLRGDDVHVYVAHLHNIID